MQVKFCGLTRLEDALAAIELGAGMLGFNFYPRSPRYISPEACARLLTDLSGALDRPSGRIQVVGVFVNAKPERVKSILADCRLDAAQLSGDETPGQVNQIGSPAFKALRLGPGVNFDQAVRSYHVRRDPPVFLIDANIPGEYGGTGRTGDWQAARQAARVYPVLLAGGLNPDNVRAAIKEVQPWGVDVASGIESMPGIKDYRKMAKFIQAVRAAEDEMQ